MHKRIVTVRHSLQIVPVSSGGSQGCPEKFTAKIAKLSPSRAGISNARASFPGQRAFSCCCVASAVRRMRTFVGSRSTGSVLQVSPCSLKTSLIALTTVATDWPAVQRQEHVRLKVSQSTVVTHGSRRRFSTARMHDCLIFPSCIRDFGSQRISMEASRSSVSSSSVIHLPPPLWLAPTNATPFAISPSSVVFFGGLCRSAEALLPSIPWCQL